MTTLRIQTPAGKGLQDLQRRRERDRKQRLSDTWQALQKAREEPPAFGPPAAGGLTPPVNFQDPGGFRAMMQAEGRFPEVVPAEVVAQQGAAALAGAVEPFGRASERVGAEVYGAFTRPFTGQGYPTSEPEDPAMAEYRALPWPVKLAAESVPFIAGPLSSAGAAQQALRTGAMGTALLGEGGTIGGRLARPVAGTLELAAAGLEPIAAGERLVGQGAEAAIKAASGAARTVLPLPVTGMIPIRGGAGKVSRGVSESTTDPTISQVLGGKRSMVFADLVSNQGSRIRLRLQPDTSQAGVYSVVATTPTGNRGFRMQYPGGMKLSEVRDHFETYINTDAPEGIRHTVELIAPRGKAVTSSSLDDQIKAQIRAIETRRYKTRGDEIALGRLKRTLSANPSKWQKGQGVGWRVVSGQVNRGYRIEQVLSDTKEAIIRPVGDIGVLADYTGEPERVSIIDLLRDRKYDLPPAPREAETTAEAPIAQTVLPEAPAAAPIAHAGSRLNITEIRVLRRAGIESSVNPTIGEIVGILNRIDTRLGKLPSRNVRQYAELSTARKALLTEAQTQSGLDETALRSAADIAPPESYFQEFERQRIATEKAAPTPVGDVETLGSPEVAPELSASSAFDASIWPGFRLFRGKSLIPVQLTPGELSRIQEARSGPKAGPKIDSVHHAAERRGQGDFEAWMAKQNEGKPYNQWVVGRPEFTAVEEGGLKTAQFPWRIKTKAPTETILENVPPVASQVAPEPPGPPVIQPAAAQPSPGGAVPLTAVTPPTPPSVSPKAIAPPPPPPPPPPPVPPVEGLPPGSPGGPDAVEWFRRFLKDPQRIEDWTATLEQRREVLGGRLGGVEPTIEQLVKEGYSSEEAVRLARQALRGEMPTVTTGIQQVVTPAVRTALFDKVRSVLAGDALAMISTHEALTNALLGRAIPRTPGTAGGSAYSRLVRVFGDDIAEAITQGQTLDEAIALRAGGKAGPKGAVGPKTTPWIEYPPDRAFGASARARLTEEPRLLEAQERPLIPQQPSVPFPERPPDLRSQGEREIDLQVFRLMLGGGKPPTGPTAWIEYPPDRAFGIPGRTMSMEEPRLLEAQQRPLISQQPSAPFPERPPDLRSPRERDIDLQVFRLMLGGGKPPTGLTAAGRVAMGDIPPDAVIKQASFISETDRERMLRWAKYVGLTAMDLGNLVRANMASVDLSYMRQQAFLIPRHLGTFAQTFPDALKAMWSKEYAESLDHMIKSDPMYRYYEGGPDFLRALNSKVAKAWEREEQFLVLGGDRPLQQLAQKMPWLNISNRAFVTGINSMNWQIYKGYVRTLLRKNEQIAAGLIKMKPGEALSIKQAADNYAGMLADMSGRGPLGPLKEMSPALNAAFFSVRLNIGRLISPRHLVSSDAGVRRAAWENFMAAIGAFSGLLFAGQQMGLWDVETDPRSSDFMKLRLGRLRIDPWGGYQQFAVLYGRLLPLVGGIKSTRTGEVSDYDPATGVWNFARTKASPLISDALTAWSGKDFKGSAVDRKDWRRWLRENGTLAVSDVIEAFQAEGLVGLFAGVPAATVGAGLYAQEPSLNDVAQELYQINYSDIPVEGTGGLARKRIREELQKRLSARELEAQSKVETRTAERGTERETERREKFRRALGLPDTPPLGISSPLAPSGEAIRQQRLKTRWAEIQARRAQPVAP